MLPLKINCWPEEEARGQMNVSIEYSMDLSSFELHEVSIVIPLNTAAVPAVVSADGAHRYNAQTQSLVWEIDLIDKSNASGSLEFNIAQRDSNAFFPINVHFSSKQLFCPVEVLEVQAMGTGAPILYGLSRGMASEEYVIA
jgi:coatomer subunit delta